MGGGQVSRAALYYLKRPVSNKKNYEEGKQTGKYDPYTRKKAGNRNCESNQISDLTEKDFNAAIKNMFKERLKKTII